MQLNVKRAEFLIRLIVRSPVDRHGVGVNLLFGVAGNKHTTTDIRLALFVFHNNSKFSVYLGQLLKIRLALIG